MFPGLQLRLRAQDVNLALLKINHAILILLDPHANDAAICVPYCQHIHRGIMDMKKVCKGRTGKACTACEQLCSNLHDVTDASGTESEESVTESESSDLLDDVIVLDHKPSNWIDRSPGKSKKRRREEDQMMK
ncbi:uncharacterized protein F5147DRAFT_659548 [Suillus discolor]|uniref:Uncharacterized protein n=1 Tax=Suillus discolor TaxID=1912936 RepID=A0A9P7EQU0_9AGAM|nr:uncharacterized protein F5147DRAFT_659548 [Suillus discolor]KAG2085340.1 hypothetical protein F5147DRAFT_659548 [Suillus discolor]